MEAENKPKTIGDLIKRIQIKDVIFVAIIVIMGLFWCRSCQNKSIMQDRYENNIAALCDTITYLENEKGELVASKLAFETDVNTLKSLNAELYNEISDLNVKLKKLQSGAHFDGQIVYQPGDTVYIVKHDTIQNGFEKKFDFSNNWRLLSGSMLYQNDSLSLHFDKDIVNFDYTIGLDKDNNIHIKSDNPFVKYNEISGFTVPKPRPKRWGLSVYAGFGINLGYNPFQQKTQMTLGPSVGFAVTYDLIQW